MPTFAIPFDENRGLHKIFEKTEIGSTSKYREKKESRALILLKNTSVSIKLREIKKYTKKSLILAQDER